MINQEFKFESKFKKITIETLFQISGLIVLFLMLNPKINIITITLLPNFSKYQ